MHLLLVTNRCCVSQNLNASGLHRRPGKIVWGRGKVLEFCESGSVVCGFDIDVGVNGLVNITDL